jgi:hypothetical protein
VAENPVEREVDLHRRITALEQQVEQLQSNRPGRKRVPIVVSSRGVCGIDPDRNSERCPDATVYRRQQGCMGEACMKVSSEYYKKIRSERQDVPPSS